MQENKSEISENAKNEGIQEEVKYPIAYNADLHSKRSAHDDPLNDISLYSISR